MLVGVPVLLGVLVGVRRPAAALGFAGRRPAAAGGARASSLFVQVRFFQLAAPALVLERTGVFASLRRAGRLSRGQFWRIFGVLLLTGLVVGVVGQVVAVPLGVVGAGRAGRLPRHGRARCCWCCRPTSPRSWSARSPTPFTSAVTALQYVDQRIRKEGLDVELIAASQRRPGPR